MLCDNCQATLAALSERPGEGEGPEIHDFMAGIVSEAAHQRERWGEAHDAEKSPEDWLWLIAFLSTKATQALRYGDHEKYLHHIVTTAAACLNWHAQARGEAPTPPPRAPEAPRP